MAKNKKNEILKVAVDFDETLHNWEHDHTIKSLVKTLIKGGADIYIITAREKFPNEKYNKQVHNDLYLVAKDLNIPNEKIIMTAYKLKFHFMKELGIKILIDDNWQHIHDVNRNGGCGMLLGYDPLKDISKELNFIKQINNETG